MIVDKENKPIIKDPVTTESEQVTTNALINVYQAVKKVLLSLHENPNDDSSPLIFKTVKMDNGQFARIIRNKKNEESALEFPAAFIHFINVRYLVQQQRIGEGRATLRIRFVLNRLNNSDDGFETEGYNIFERINVAIQDAKTTEEALNERCNLTYFDQPETSDNGLQAFWIDYEIWFRETSAWQYRNYVDRYLVVPPFTNRLDQNAKINPDRLPNYNEPKYGVVSEFNATTKLILNERTKLTGKDGVVLLYTKEPEYKSKIIPVSQI